MRPRRPSRTRELLATFGTGLLLLVACGDGDAAGPDPTDGSDPAVTGTASPTATAAPTDTGSPTGTEPSTSQSPTVTATASPDGTAAGTVQTFVVAPQEPHEVAVGSSATFSVGATYDGGAVPDRLWLGVVPCGRYDVETQAFTGTDGTVEGFDEDFGPRVHDVNGERYENVDDVWPTEVHVQDGVLTFTLSSEREACAIATVFRDVDDDGELDVDDHGTAVEPYGVGQATWS